MSHMKIASKIHEIMRLIPDEQAFDKINEALIEQKLITQTEYKIVEHKEQVTRSGLVLQIVTVSCGLTIIDTESDEAQTNIAHGSGLDAGSSAVDKAQVRARKHAWMATLNITPEDIPFPEVVSEPEIIVETPESKLIAHITALWKARWDLTLLQGWIEQRFKKPIEQLNITELSIVKSELENYGR